MVRRLLTKLSVVTTMVALAFVPCFASEILTFTGGTYIPSANSQTVGWAFTANSALQVTDLAWYDPDGTNLTNRPVGIWDNNGQLVLSTCVGATCGSTWIDGYWVTPVTASLPPGNYVIGGYVWANGVDSFVLGNPIITTDPSITYIESRYLVSPDFLEPTRTCCGNGFFGPNFSIMTSVPEPASMSFIVLGFGIAGCWRRFKS